MCFHPPFSERSKISNSVRASISLDCHQLYIAIVANGCGYTQGPFWLPWRIILVGRENQIQNLLDDAPPTYVSSTYVSSFAYASAKTQIQRCLCNCRRNLAISYGWEAESLQPSIRLRYNYYVQLVATRRDWMRVPNLKFWSPRQRRGGEASRAIDCK